MNTTVRYRCGGCESEFTVEGESQPRVVCVDCEQVTTPLGDRAAMVAYRVGYAKYREGRRQLGSGLRHLERTNWVDGRALLNGAAEAFEDAVEQFTRAVRRADGGAVKPPSERARQKGTCLWQAADWLSGVAYAREQCVGDRAETFQREAKRQLERAGEHGELPSPDALDGTTTADAHDPAPAGEAAPAEGTALESDV